MRKIIFLLCYCVYFFTYAQKWEMKQAPLMTPWSKNIDIHHVLPEYPRPLMQREDWKNLNGVWEFEMSTEGDLLPTKRKLHEKILVPYPWESALSGVRRQLSTQRAWYKRTFTLPKEWSPQRRIRSILFQYNILS